MFNSWHNFKNVQFSQPTLPKGRQCLCVCTSNNSMPALYCTYISITLYVRWIYLIERKMRLYAASDGDVLVHGLAPPGGHRCHLSLHGAHVQTSHLQSSLRALPRGQYPSVPTLNSMSATSKSIALVSVLANCGKSLRLGWNFFPFSLFFFQCICHI